MRDWMNRRHLNLLAMPLAVLGLLHPVVAEICMAASSINVVVNAMRLRKYDPEKAIARMDRAPDKERTE